MKHALLALTLLLLCGATRGEETLLDKLKQIRKISDIQSLEGDHFTEYYRFSYEQPVDHEHPERGTFRQKVVIGHKNDRAPVVAELEGYSLQENRIGELTQLLGANEIRIEHRFFGSSIPASGIDWDKLTIKQAAADHHALISLLKKHLYPSSKWISTGISKGGQAVIFHRYFYPDDVHVSVPYVAPLNEEQTDPRIEKYLAKLGTNKIGLKNFIFGEDNNQDECFLKIKEFQLLCFEQIDKLVEKLQEEAAPKHYTFQHAGGEKRAVELIILEYPFSFWQWGHECGEIPAGFADVNTIYEHLLTVSNPRLFEDKSIEQMYPYLYSAFTETGIYTYNIKPFRHYLRDKNNITFAFALPPDVEIKPFNAAQMQAIRRWLQEEASRMLFIYGGLDPWSATAVDLKENPECRKYVKADMHHGCRIKDFEAITRQDILTTLHEWLQ